MAFGVVRLTLVITGAFLIYYALYGALLLFSSDCSLDSKGRPQKTPVKTTRIGISIVIAIVAGCLMLYFSHSIGESWQEAEQSLGDAPFYSETMWEHSAEAGIWAVHSIRYAMAAAVIFPTVFYWMKIHTLGPLGDCQKETDSFLAQTRDALGSLEPGVYIVMGFLVIAVIVSFRNWRGYRSADKMAARGPDEDRKFGDRTVERIQATKQKFADLHQGLKNIKGAVYGRSRQSYSSPGGEGGDNFADDDYGEVDVPLNASSNSSHSKTSSGNSSNGVVGPREVELSGDEVLHRLRHGYDHPPAAQQHQQGAPGAPTHNVNQQQFHQPAPQHLHAQQPHPSTQPSPLHPQPQQHAPPQAPHVQQHQQPHTGINLQPHQTAQPRIVKTATRQSSSASRSSSSSARRSSSSSRGQRS